KRMCWQLQAVVSGAPPERCMRIQRRVHATERHLNSTIRQPNRLQTSALTHRRQNVRGTNTGSAPARIDTQNAALTNLRDELVPVVVDRHDRVSDQATGPRRNVDHERGRGSAPNLTDHALTLREATSRQRLNKRLF